MEEESVDYIVEKLAKVGKTNNLAARISVAYTMIRNSGSIRLLREDQILSIRIIAEENKDIIDEKVMSMIRDLVDYFESFLVMEKLEGN